MPFMLDHLWQSTLFAAVAMLAAWSLGRNRARARYVVWLAASVKFLIPFAAFAALGSVIHYRIQAPIASPPIALLATVDAATTPFAGGRALAGLAAAHAPAQAHGPLGSVLLAIWGAGFLAVSGRWCLEWTRAAALARRASGPRGTSEERIQASASVRVGFVDTRDEPGVFGFVRPILLWPRDASAVLTESHVDAIVAHEMSHVRWRDNAAAFVHMIVRAVFWFHPLVWWISARLIDERERACDEEVLVRGNEPRVYAEGILRICEFRLGSPPACVAGVTGSDLRRRISDIMRGRVGQALGTPQKALLAALAIGSLGAPIGVTAWRGQNGSLAISEPAPAASFEAASIKQNLNGTTGPQAFSRMSLLAPGERVSFVNVPLRNLILSAYPGYTVIEGPEWIGAPGPPTNKVLRFDVNAKAMAPATHDELVMMLRALLADRFKMVVHAETKDEPVYALVLARSDGKLGPGLRPEARDCEALRAPIRGTAGASDPCGVPPETNNATLGSLSARSRMLDLMCALLRFEVERPVVNKTGLTASYDWDLKWTPRRFLEAADRNPPPPGIDANGPSIFTAVQEQLGLKLVAEKDGQPFLVVDHVESPTED